MAGRTARSLLARFDNSKGAFPANLLEGGDSLVLAALDPLAVPLFCGMDEDLRRYPELIGQLKTHAETCLQPGRCLDSKSGGLRLSSASANTWPSKVALVLASTGWLENRSPKETAPGAYARLGAWLQGAAKRVTVSDQIDASTGEVLGGSYYPRLVTIEALIKSGTSIKTAVSKK